MYFMLMIFCFKVWLTNDTNFGFMMYCLLVKLRILIDKPFGGFKKWSPVQVVGSLLISGTMPKNIIFKNQFWISHVYMVGVLHIVPPSCSISLRFLCFLLLSQINPTDRDFWIKLWAIQLKAKSFFYIGQFKHKESASLFCIMKHDRCMLCVYAHGGVNDDQLEPTSGAGIRSNKRRMDFAHSGLLN